MRKTVTGIAAMNGATEGRRGGDFMRIHAAAAQRAPNQVLTKTLLVCFPARRRSE